MKYGKYQLVITVAALFLMLPLVAQAQYKTSIPTIPGLTLGSSSSFARILGIDLSRVDFQNSYSMQISTMGNNTVAMGLLKSSFSYVVNPQVNVRGFVGFVHSPFSTFAPFEEQYSFMNGFNKDNIIYGGEITYQPKENISLHIGINKLPFNPYQQYYAPNPYTIRGY